MAFHFSSDEGKVNNVCMTYLSDPSSKLFNETANALDDKCWPVAYCMWWELTE